MGKVKVLSLIALVLLGILVLSVPAILRAMPSRYVARLPQPFQQWGMPRNQAPILPTLAVAANADELLSTTAVSQPDPAIPATYTHAAPATPTPPPVEGAATTPAITETLPPPATPSPTPLPIPTAARLEGFTHNFQTWNNCGPATLAMTLSYFDLGLTQQDTAAVLKPDPEDRNVSPYEMAAYVDEETPFMAIDRANGRQETVRRLIAHGIPVILEIGIEPPGEYRWMGWYGHYLLVVAYDDAQEQYWVYDSWFGTSEEPLQNAHRDGRALPYDTVAQFWPHFNRNYIAVYRSEQAETVATIIGAEMDDAVMWQNSLANAQKETAAQPDNPFFWFNLGTSYNATGDYERAAAAFDQARQIGLPWRMLWYQFGPYEAYYQVGRYEDVILLADVTLKDRPYFEESFYYKGLALAASGDPRQAQEYLQKAVSFNSNFAPAVTALNQLEEGS